MALAALMWFQNYDGSFLDSESQIDLSKQAHASSFDFPPAGNIFEIDDYSFDITQVLNIGAQSTGAGAGRVTFDPLSITRKTDRASPVLYQMACAGTAFESVVLALTRSAGGAFTGSVFEKFTFKLVAVKSVAWSQDDEAPKEVVTFGYGGLVIEYWIQNPDGSLGSRVLGGWNAVKNVLDHDPNASLT